LNKDFIKLSLEKALPCYNFTMADKNKPKTTQLGLDEYNKIKEKRAKDRLKLQFPLFIKLFVFLPIAYLVFLMAFYLIYIRFATDH
jgi:hypothetical protein